MNTAPSQTRRRPSRLVSVVGAVLLIAGFAAAYVAIAGFMSSVHSSDAHFRVSVLSEARVAPAEVAVTLRVTNTAYVMGAPVCSVRVDTESDRVLGRATTGFSPVLRRGAGIEVVTVAVRSGIPDLDEIRATCR